MTYDTLRLEDAVEGGNGTGVRNATVRFRAYAQCAADIYGVTFEAGFGVECGGGQGGGEMCQAVGEVLAGCVGQEYLPPIRNPPPPPCTWCKGGRRS